MDPQVSLVPSTTTLVPKMSAFLDIVRPPPPPLSPKEKKEEKCGMVKKVEIRCYLAVVLGGG